MQTQSRREQRRAELSGRADKRARQQAATRQRRIVTLAASAIVVLVVALVAVRLLRSGSSQGTPDQPAPDSLVAQVTSVDSTLLEQVGKGTAAQLPTPIRASVEQDSSGLPLITYIGAEYCPYCAAERWPLIVALGRFGTFSGLELSHSATNDVYPDTPTFSFVHASYSSPYVEFAPVELQSNVPSANGYQQLQTPTPAQTSLLQKYDAAPYVPAQAAGSIPFIDFAGQYMVSGASYDAGLLRGMTQDQVAADLSDASNRQAQAILGTANVLTAAICSATGESPAQVCGLTSVKSIEAMLVAAPVPGKG